MVTWRNRARSWFVLTAALAAIGCESPCEEVAAQLRECCAKGPAELRAQCDRDADELEQDGDTDSCEHSLSQGELEGCGQ